MELTQEYLKSILDYDPDTGIFTRVNYIRGGYKAGTVAGNHPDKSHGYGTIRIKDRLYYSHRLAWLYVHGHFPDGQIDHADGNRMNNRLDNLSDVPHAANTMNRCLSRKNTSGHIGVSWYTRKGKWSAEIYIDGKATKLGMFARLDDAVRARRAAARKHGYHPNHGREPHATV